MLKIVDINGQILNEFDGNKYYVRSRKQDDFYKKKEESRNNFSEYNEETGKFIWAYPDKIQEIIHSKDFTKADLTMIFYLATYVNGFGVLTHDNNNVKLEKNDLQSLLGVGRNLFGKFYNKLISHGILKESGKNFKWNESYNFYGSTSGKANPTLLIRTYVNQVRELYDTVKEDGKKKYSPTALYPVFALVPYLHHTSNIICKNPEEKNIDDIIYFSLTELSDLLDLKDSKKMSASLSSILLDGQTTFRKVSSKNEVYLQLNPRIFWRGVEAPHKHLVSEFNMMDYNRKIRSDKRKNN